MRWKLDRLRTEKPAHSGRYERIILHIGMNKTGSSAIQASLRGFDDGSNLYAPFEYINHSIPLYTVFAAKYARYNVWRDRGLNPQQIEAKRAELQARLTAILERRDRRTLIFSGEDIGLIDSAGVANLVETLRPHAESVQVICYVRAPLGFAASAFQQRCQGGLARVPAGVDPLYRQRIEAFITQLGRENVTLRRFDRATLKDGDVVQDFCDFAGVTLTGPSRREANPSLSSAALKLLFGFNQRGLLTSGDAVLRRARLDLIRELRDAYADAPRIESDLFHPLAVFDDVEWLRDSCGIDFSGEAATAAQSREELGAWLSDISAVDPAPLRALLSKYGLNGRYPEMNDQISRLYYHLVHLSQKRADAAS